jgi:hypothetical protein
LKEIGVAELTDEQLEELCKIGEKAAKAYIHSRVHEKRISRLDITIEAEGRKPVTVNVEIEVGLSAPIDDVDIYQVAKEAAEKALEETNKYLRELSCKSTK